MMHIQNLSKSFGSKTVLNDINILFEEGLPLIMKN